MSSITPQKAYKANWYQANKERIAATKKERYQKNKEAISELGKAKYVANPEYYKEKAIRYALENPEAVSLAHSLGHLKRTYGLTEEKYQELLANQGGSCAICSGPPTGRGKKRNRFYVDHDHETGAVRGLLCHGCNTGIGHLKDSKEVLMKAIAYLEKAAK